MSISQLTLKSSDEEPVRRFEVFTGRGRRREWSDEQKAQIVAESYEPGVKVCSVARRHGLTPQQLFTWRRLARKPLGAVPDVDVPMFAPAVLDVPTTPAAKGQEPLRAARRKSSTGAIELELGHHQDRIRDRRRDDYSGHSRASPKSMSPISFYKQKINSHWARWGCRAGIARCQCQRCRQGASCTPLTVIGRFVVV
jgi:transposase